jgi:MIP family channel proteins
MYNLPQRLTAEFLGTFALVFFGAGAICADQFLHGAAGPNLLLIAAVQGLVIAVMYSALSHISGGHFNPAITIGFWVTKRSSTVEVALYWVAQVFGAILAAFLLKAVLPEDAWRAATLGTPELVRDFPRLSAMVLEAIATFFLVLVFFATTVDEGTLARPLAGFSIGLTAMVGVAALYPFTGAAMNPARALGPALAASHWANAGVFWIGPLAGGFLAGLLYDSLYLKKP